MLYWLAKNLTYLVSRLLFNMRYEGLENIPKSGSYVLCSNHRTNFDPIFMCHKIPVQLHFMAKQELFRIPVLGWLISRVGAFPIARGEGDTATIDKAVDILRQGGVLLIFPEGTRSKDNQPLRPRSGVSLISARAGVGVLPVSIDYVGKLFFRKRVTMRFHPILTREALGVDLESPRTMRTGAKLVMNTIISGLTLPKALPEGEKGSGQ